MNERTPPECTKSHVDDQTLSGGNTPKHQQYLLLKGGEEGGSGRGVRCPHLWEHGCASS